LEKLPLNFQIPIRNLFQGLKFQTKTFDAILVKHGMDLFLNSHE